MEIINKRTYARHFYQ